MVLEQVDAHDARWKAEQDEETRRQAVGLSDGMKLFQVELCSFANFVRFFACCCLEGQIILIQKRHEHMQKHCKIESDISYMSIVI